MDTQLAQQATNPENIGVVSYATSTALGCVGAGISVGIRLSRGEKINRWLVITTVVAGMATAGACTQAMVSFAHIEAYWSGAVSLLLGLMAMGFMLNAYDGKIPFINKFMGGKNE